MFIASSRRLVSSNSRHTRIIFWGSFGGSKPTPATELHLALPQPPSEKPWKLTSVSCGSKHMAFVTEEGHRIVIGSNRQGQNGQPVHSAGPELGGASGRRMSSSALGGMGSLPAATVDELTPYWYTQESPAAASAAEQSSNGSPCNAVACSGNSTIFYRKELQPQGAEENPRPTTAKGSDCVYACGLNLYGQLGLGHNNVIDNAFGFGRPVTSEHNPNQLVSSAGRKGMPWFDNLRKIVTGYQQTFFMQHDGSVWACGANMRGELGTGDDETVDSPLKLQFAEEQRLGAKRWKQFREDPSRRNELCWVKQYPRLGHEEEEYEHPIDSPDVLDPHDVRYAETPVTIRIAQRPQDPDPIVDISPGCCFTYFLTKSGRLYGCGSVVGPRSASLLHKPTPVPLLQTFSRQLVDDVHNHNHSGLRRLRADKVACGGTFVVMATKKGELFLRGSFEEIGCSSSQFHTHQIRVPSIAENKSTTKMQYLTCAGSTGVAVDQAGTIFGFGGNTEGQLKLTNVHGTNVAPPVFADEAVPIATVRESTSPVEYRWDDVFSLGPSFGVLLDEECKYEVPKDRTYVFFPPLLGREAPDYIPAHAIPKVRKLSLQKQR